MKIEPRLDTTPLVGPYFNLILLYNSSANLIAIIMDEIAEKSDYFMN